MSKRIDNRAVQMQFDNQQFEKGISTSVKSLDNLKKSLDLSVPAKSISTLQDISKKLNLDNLGNNIEKIADKFSLMGMIGVNALQRIASSAVDAGERLIKSLTIDPISTGFKEYETQINAIQTILANTSSKGTTMDQVVGALDELNTYADKTIYNFTEMTRNIGTFTAAGIDLDTSVSAIKGIANLAAVSGSTSQQASTAMYQLSQALASGTVKLMDWNSVVNAGMGGQVFQDALKETARVHGINIDKIIKEQGSFRESLSEGWLTSAVLTETLAKFTGDLSEEQIKSMGYTEAQAKEILKMGVTASDAATKVKTFTQLFDTLKEAAQSGWSKSWQIIIGDFEEAKSMLTEMSDAFGDYINRSSEMRNTLLQGWKDMGGRNELLTSFWNIVMGLEHGYAAIRDAAREIFPPVTVDSLMNITHSIFAMSNALFDFVEKYEGEIKSIFRGFFAILDIGRIIIRDVAKGFGNLLKEVLPVGGQFIYAAADVGEFLVGIRDVIKETDIFAKGIDKAVEFLKPFAKGISDVFTTARVKLTDFLFGDTTDLDNLSEDISGRLSGLQTVGEKTRDVFNHLSDKANDISSKVTPIFEKVAGVLKVVYDKVKEFTGKAIDNFDLGVAFDIGGFAMLMTIGKKIAGFFDTITGAVDKGSGLLDGVKGILDGVRGSLEAWQKNLQAKTLLTIAGAVGVLAASLFIIAGIDADKLASSLGAVGILFGELVVAMSAFQASTKTGGFKTAGLSLTFIAMSASVLILAFAMKTLSDLDWDAVGKGIVTVGILIGALIGMSKALAGSTGTIAKASGGLILFGIAIGIIAGSVKKLGEMDTGTILQGLLGFTVLIAQVSVAMNLLSNVKVNPSSFIGLLAFGIAVGLLSGAVKKMGNMDVEKMMQGLLGLTTVIAMFVLALNTIPENAGVKALSLLGLAVALVVVAGAIKMIGSMSWEQLGKGLIGLAGALVILGVALGVMSGSIGGSAALLLMAVALAVLVPALKSMGKMKISEIAKSLITLAAVFAIIGIAGTVLAPAAVGVLALAAAIGLLGLAILAIGAGVSLFAGGITLLASAGAVGAKALQDIIITVLDTIPIAFDRVAQGVIAFATAIGDSADQIAESFGKVVKAIVTLVADLVVFLLETIEEKTPDIVNAGFGIILSLLEGIRDNIPGIVTVATDIIVAFLNTMGENLPRIIDAGVKFIISFINGMANAIRENSYAVGQAGANLAGAIIEGIINFIFGALGELGNAIGRIGETIIKNLGSAVKGVWDAGWNVGKNIVKGIGDGIGSFANGVKNAAGNVGNWVLDGIKGVLDINSPSGETKKLGVFTTKGFINGLVGTLKSVKDAGMNMGRTALNGISNVLSKAEEGVASISITPVVDYNSLVTDIGVIRNNLGNLDLDIGTNLDNVQKIKPVVKTETVVVHKHEFDTLHVEGVDDEGEFVAVADYTVEDRLTAQMRRDGRTTK